MSSPRSSSSAVQQAVRLSLVLGAGAVVCAGARAQDAGAGLTPALVPTFSADTTYLETRGRIDGLNGREGIFRVSPGLQYISRSGLLRGALDYTANLIDSRGSGASTGGDVQNALNAAFVAEAVPNTAFVDMRAMISQQSISAFGEQSVTGSLQPGDKNRTEVSTLSLTPYVRGTLAGGVAEYDLRGTAGATRSRGAGGVDSHNTGVSMTLRSPRHGALLDWGLEGSEQIVAYSNLNAVQDRRAFASLGLSPDPELRFELRGGRESADDGTTVGQQLTTTVGAGLQWTPTPRTNIVADVERRYFGHSANIVFTHRMVRSLWSYTLTRDTTKGADAFTLGAPMTLYQLLYAGYANITDPVQRDQLVRAQIGDRDPNQLVPVGFQSSSLSVQQRQDLSFAWFGDRLSWTLEAYTTSVSQLLFVAGADAATGEPVRQHGYTSSLSYQLTPLSAVVLSGSRSMTFGTSTQTGNDLKSANLALTSRISPKASVQFGARYSVFNSLTEPYRETALSGSLNLRF